MLEDLQIIDLFWARDPAAITETENKYGSYCMKIANNILDNGSDAEECVNDTYLRTWETIPPQRPEVFPPFLGKIVRNIALDRYRYHHAQKRFGKIDAMLSELEDCIPDGDTTAEHLEASIVTDVINSYLAGLSKEKRLIFVRRYWYSQSIREIAKAFCMNEGQVKSILFRLRGGLKLALEKEGVAV